MFSIQHNMMAWNANRQFNTVTNAKNKKTEKLSSGYRINRAGDDAAGLSISEKMRRQIRGLKVGTENAQDGVSWVQIGEGALNEAHDILQRMSELTIKAMNGTNTLTDRAYMEAEFEHLQSEIDRISTTTTFNELNIFREHDYPHDQICGNIRWDYEQIHEVKEGKNQLVINYREDAYSPVQTVTLEVKAGKYTTHELIDEIDNAAGVFGPVHVEFTEKGLCNVNLEGGAIIEDVSGGLTYLLFDTYDGGGYGALIGTTIFPNETDKLLTIERNQNDSMEFDITYFDEDKTDTVKVNLFDAAEELGLVAANAAKMTLSKLELMDIIDNAVEKAAPDSGLKTSHYGDSIMLSSEKGIVTGFKGNMFKIENAPDDIFTSVFYDNIQYGYVWHDPASVVGGAVLTSDTRDKEHNRYYIDSSNNTLVLQPNLMETPTTITIDTNTTDGYTAAQMVAELNKKFQAAGIDGEVKAYEVVSKSKESVGDDSVLFHGVEIRTVKEGPDSIVNIDKAASTAYDTLFTIKDFNSYGTATDAKIDNETTNDVNAYAEGSRDYSDGKAITIKNGVNDSFKITLTSKNEKNQNDYTQKEFTIDILTGSTKSKNMSKTDIINAINAQINAHSELKDRIEAKAVTTTFVDKDWNIKTVQTIQIVDKINKESSGYLEPLTDDQVKDDYLNWKTTIQLSSNGGNNGYRDIFQQQYTYDVVRTVSSTNGTLSINTGGAALSGGMWVNINGKNEYFDFGGATTVAGAVAAINKTTPIEFAAVNGIGTNYTRTFSMNGQGKTYASYYAGGHAEGTSEVRQGIAGFYQNAPASLVIGPQLKSSMAVSAAEGNNKITLALNGVQKTLTLADGTYDAAGLVDALQKAIDEAFRTGMGGATVSLSGNQLVITSRLPTGEDGKKTSITAYERGTATNTFFDYLNRVDEAATCTSSEKVSSSITLEDGVNDILKFRYTDSTGTQEVEIDLTSAASETISSATFKTRINNALTAGGYKVSADIVNNRLVLTTGEKGAQTSISFNSTGSSSADAIFGLSKETTAEITLDKNVKTSASYSGAKTFKVQVDGVWKEVNITGGWSSLSATDSNGLVYKLNKQFQDNGIDVTASVSGSRLTLTKNSSGSGTLHMDYASGGTVMGDMFGYEPKPGVSVTYSGNTINITGGKNDLISVTSNTSGGTVKPGTATGYYTHNSATGYHSAKYSSVTSTALDPNGIVITRWNKDLQFTFKQGNTNRAVDIELTESVGGTPTSLEDIRKELQDKIDAKLGADVVEVLLEKDNNNKDVLVMKSKKPGSQFQFSGMQSNSTAKIGGGFYHHVMCGYTEKKNKLDDPEDVNGEQWADDIFAQGRHDVVTKLTKLRPGVSDTLILDLTFVPDTDHDNNIEADKQQTLTLEMKLDANMREEDFYNADKLKKMIQEKLDEAISSEEVQKKAEDLGIVLHEGVIEVDVGRHKTDIWGNKDDVSISFTITKDHDIATPVEGYFYIDGIRGNAAYETFYYTEGEMIPAYIIGTKDISKGVTLGKDDTDLSFVVDGKNYTVKLDKGTYSPEKLVKTITDKFKEQDIPLAAEVTKKGVLKISHQRMGTHIIEKVSGGARDELFFTEHKSSEPFQERYVRISSQEGDRIELYTPRYSTLALNINSICISQPKYAEKALERLKQAISTTSEIRSTFGSIQNRLEHAINNNRNKEENLQAAESRIRDTDVAREMVEYSNLGIIQQAGQAILAQANQSRNELLKLLG